MATDRRGPTGQPRERRDGDGATLRIHSCGRIGMQANPPRSRLGGWLRRR